MQMFRVPSFSSLPAISSDLRILSYFYCACNAENSSKHNNTSFSYTNETTIVGKRMLKANVKKKGPSADPISSVRKVAIFGICIQKFTAKCDRSLRSDTGDRRTHSDMIEKCQVQSTHPRRRKPASSFRMITKLMSVIEKCIWLPL